MDNTKIENKMKELAENLHYDFRNIRWLRQAMDCQKLSNGKYKNQPLATLGDAVLKFTLAEYLYNQKNDQEKITTKKKKIENNATLCDIRDALEIYRYAYNDNYFFCDAPKHEKLPNPKHDSYIEAIIAAIYKDRGIQYCKKWIIDLWRNNKLLD